MKELILLIPICSLSVGVAYSVDAPAGKIRIAAIAALPVTALPKALMRRTTSARAALDLRPPDLSSMPRTDSFPASIPAESAEPQASAVVTAALPRDETSNTNLPLTGIGSFYWAARHSTRVWRILIPRQADDEFGAYMDTRTWCSVLPGTPDGRPACP